MMSFATGCDCPEYPAEAPRDCCCVGGTECVDGHVRCRCCREYPTPDCACDCHQNIEPPDRGPSPVAAESSTAVFSSGPVAPPAFVEDWSDPAMDAYDAEMSDDELTGRQT